MEVTGLERVKEDMVKEISKLTLQADQLHQVEEEMKELKDLYVKTEQKYQTMLTVLGQFSCFIFNIFYICVLQMYGEKVEEAEELRLDLQDVKELYKIQIEEVLKSSKVG